MISTKAMTYNNNYRYIYNTKNIIIGIKIKANKSFIYSILFFMSSRAIVLVITPIKIFIKALKIETKKKY